MVLGVNPCIVDQNINAPKPRLDKLSQVHSLFLIRQIYNVRIDWQTSFFRYIGCNLSNFRGAIYRRAVAAPIPMAAPVITATFKVFSMFICYPICKTEAFKNFP